MNLKRTIARQYSGAYCNIDRFVWNLDRTFLYKSSVQGVYKSSSIAKETVIRLKISFFWDLITVYVFGTQSQHPILSYRAVKRTF